MCTHVCTVSKTLNQEEAVGCEFKISVALKPTQQRPPLYYSFVSEFHCVVISVHRDLETKGSNQPL